MEMKEKIMEAVIELFNEKGCHFTLDDIEKKLRISRKTVYKYFLSKNDILKSIIDDAHEGIHVRQQEIFRDPHMGVKEKLFAALTIEARHEDKINLRRLYEMEQDAPEVFTYFMNAYEDNWGIIEALLRQGMEEGILRPMNVELIRRMLADGMETCYHGDFLLRNNLQYKEALHQVVDIVMEGLVTGK